MYSELFSKIYDEFGWNYYPEAFGETLLKWIAERGLKVESVLDIGCGTGILCKLLRENGIRADGIDLSEPMIRIAKERDPEGDYRTADMTTFRTDRRYDLVTCTGDAINHLSDPDDILATFRNVHGYLKSRGSFIFDLLNENEVSEDSVFDYDFSETVKACFHMKKAEDGTVALSVTAFENGVQTVCEEIREKIYPAEDIRQLLYRAGFSQVSISHSLLEEGSKALTWYVVAVND